MELTRDFAMHLEAVERSEKGRVSLMEESWQPIKDRVDEKGRSAGRKDATRARELGTHPASGRAVSVRMGRYGPYAQLGRAEDEEKRKFAGLLPGQHMDEVTLEDAMQLFKLPRDLGQGPDGEPVTVGMGRYGPYVKYGGNYVSLPKDDDPHTVSLVRARELIKDKQRSESPVHTWEHEGKTIVVRVGRYGPYATDGEVNASIPKREDPDAVTLRRVLDLLEAKRKAPQHKGPPRRGRSRTAASNA